MSRALAVGERARARGVLSLRGVLGALLFALVALATHVACAQDQGEPVVHARVIVETAALRTGPGPAFRIARVAHQGDTFPVRGRATRGFWLEVELPDGSLAFVQGDMVFTHEVGAPSRSARIMAKVFAPPPLLGAHGEIAVTLGALSGSGFMAVRPSFLLAPVFGFEGNFGASVGSAGRLFLVGAGTIFNLFPSWPIVPFVAGGGGLSHASPNVDSFVLEAGTRSLLYAGGGLRLGFRHRLIVRVEARGYVLFNADDADAQQEVSGGLSAFF